MERVHYSESDVAQEEYLDRGQFGIVFKAKLRDGKEVAIKTFKPPTNIDDEKLKTLKQKFEDEARLVSDLDHPNVVKVFGLMTRNNGDLAIVMEFLPLGSLKVKRLNEMWAKSGASENEIFRKRKCFVLGLISGLDYLHNKKIVHRDLKTANILCAGDEPVPKIADFGLAKVVQCSQVYLQSYVGSMMYMAPEFFPASMDNSQIKYKKTVDIYSLAMVIYQIYTGAIRHDFYPGVEDIYVLIGYKSRGEKPKMDQLTNVVPASVAPLVDRAVDKDPKQRPSLVEFAIAVAMS